ncbi:MAG: hypothetical protein JW878_00415 [Methanomicrobia archaeon]|nr:hypothetical protein [Methanomicrobia archaeon]
MKTKLIAGLVVLALVATATGAVLARDNSGMQPPEGVESLTGAHQWSRGPGCMNQLTEEQREEVQEQMQEFRQQLAEQYGVDMTDAEREEMREQLQEKQQEQHQEMQEFRQQLAEQYGIDMTDEEREEVQEQMQEFRQQLAEQYNITCPSGPQFVDEDGDGICENMGPHMRGFRGEPGFGEFPPTPPDVAEQ